VEQALAGLRPELGSDLNSSLSGMGFQPTEGNESRKLTVACFQQFWTGLSTAPKAGAQRLEQTAFCLGRCALTRSTKAYGSAV